MMVLKFRSYTASEVYEVRSRITGGMTLTMDNGITWKEFCPIFQHKYLITWPGIQFGPLR